MTEKLLELERLLGNFGAKSHLDENTLLLFPDNFRKIHSYKLFGENLIAIPAGKNDEMEKPFTFLRSKDTLELFDSEFRTEQMDDFIQIGNACNLTEIVLLNKVKNSVHIFHISDICDKDWVTYKLNKEICSLEDFIQNLRPQTVCCFTNRGSYYPEHYVFEIRDNFELLNDGNVIKYTDEDTVWEEYYKLVDDAVKKGFIVDYAPRKVLERIR
jgi:hypothetical protein